MATIGITLFLIGLGEIIFGGETKQMITSELGIPTGSITLEPWGGLLILEEKDITIVLISGLLVVGLLAFLNKTRMGRAIRALGDDHQASMSVGISLQTIWVLVWFIAGIPVWGNGAPAASGGVAARAAGGTVTGAAAMGTKATIFFLSQRRAGLNGKLRRARADGRGHPPGPTVWAAAPGSALRPGLCSACDDVGGDCGADPGGRENGQ